MFLGHHFNLDQLWQTITTQKRNWNIDSPKPATSLIKTQTHLLRSCRTRFAQNSVIWKTQTQILIGILQQFWVLKISLNTKKSSWIWWENLLASFLAQRRKTWEDYGRFVNFGCFWLNILEYSKFDFLDPNSRKNLRGISSTLLNSRPSDVPPAPYPSVRYTRVGVANTTDSVSDQRTEKRGIFWAVQSVQPVGV